MTDDLIEYLEFEAVRQLAKAHRIDESGVSPEKVRLHLVMHERYNRWAQEVRVLKGEQLSRTDVVRDMLSGLVRK